MGATNRNSVRQRILRLEVGGTAVFPIERYDYVNSIAYRLAKQYRRRHACQSTENQTRVTRIQ